MFCNTAAKLRYKCCGFVIHELFPLLPMLVLTPTEVLGGGAARGFSF